MVVEQLPKKELLSFTSPHGFGLNRLAHYYSRCEFDICEYTVGIKLMCEPLYHYAFTEWAGCLICRDEYEGIVCFDYPVAGEGGDVDAALEKIEEYCLELDIPLRFTTLPDSVLGKLAARYDGIRLRNTYICKDYLYSTEDVRNFAGKKYAGQRNHIRKFQKLYPEARFRPLTMEDLPALKRFLEKFDRGFHKQDDPEAVNEHEEAFRLLQMNGGEIFRCGCMEYKGEIIGVALGEKCGKTLVEHIEKALARDFEGVYPAIFQAFVSVFGQDCDYVNREDDAADPGLRTSKHQYHPAKITLKYDMDVESLLYTVCEVPHIETDRLVLDAITEGDADAYAALCKDDARNRFWGYDYRIDLPMPDPNGRDFLEIVNEDFLENRTLNFAVRLDGAFIGEAVLYRFDNKGRAELGVRIASAYAGKGYGTEAFAAVAHWGLYTLSLVEIVAKCFRENHASEQMLSKVMRKVGEDEKMLYFSKKI